MPAIYLSGLYVAPFLFDNADNIVIKVLYIQHVAGRSFVSVTVVGSQQEIARSDQAALAYNKDPGHSDKRVCKSQPVR